MNPTNQKPPLDLVKVIMVLAIITASLAKCVALKAQTPGPLHKGWYRVKWLQRHGYAVPPGTRKSIYIMPTADSTRANIVAIK